MRGRRLSGPGIPGFSLKSYLLSFLTVAFTVTVALLVYGALQTSGKGVVTVQWTLLLVVLLLSALGAVLEAARRAKSSSE